MLDRPVLLLESDNGCFDDVIIHSGSSVCCTTAATSLDSTDFSVRRLAALAGIPVASKIMPSKVSSTMCGNTCMALHSFGHC